MNILLTQHATLQISVTYKDKHIMNNCSKQLKYDAWIQYHTTLPHTVNT